MLSTDFLTSRHRSLGESVRAFAEEEIRPRIPAMEQSGGVETAIASLVAQRGLIGPTIDTRYGGLDVGHLGRVEVIKQIAKVSAAMGAVVQASILGTAKIIQWGTEEQKQRWLPLVASGSCLPTIAVTESGSGSHVLGIESTAVRDGNSWILNGRKQFVGNSHIGHLHGAVFRTGEGSRGLTAFLVESDRPGVSLAPHRPALGLRGFSFGEIIFRGCRVPAENMVGDVGDGKNITYRSSITYGRLCLAAVALGLQEAMVEATVEYATRTQRYGQPLFEVSTVNQRIGAMRSRLRSTQDAVYTAAYLLDQDQDEPCDERLHHAKLVSQEGAVASAHDGMQVFGAEGLFSDWPMERYRRDADCIFAPAGTGDVQRLHLARYARGDQVPQWSAGQVQARGARS